MRLILTTLGVAIANPTAGMLLFAVMVLLWLAQVLARRSTQPAVTPEQRERFYARLQEDELRVVNVGPTVLRPRRLSD